MFLIGCSPDREAARSVSIASAFGAYIGDDIVVVPSYHWRETEAGGWRFYARGELLIHIAEGVQPPPDGIEIILRAASNSRGYGPRVTWRGQDLDGGPWVLDEDLRIPIGSDQLVPGTHRLGFDRDYQGDVRRVASSRVETDFDTVGWSLGGSERRLIPKNLARYEALREFFDLSGGQTVDEFQGGLLIDGNQAIDLAADRAGILEFQLHEIFGNHPKIAVLQPGGRSMEPGSDGLYSVTLDPEAAVRIVVEENEGLVLVGRLFFAAAEASVPEPPSIVLITLDTTRRDLLTPYSDQPGTPNLQGFAEHATVFENALSTSPWTLPSHSSIFTGLWPSQHRAGLGDKALAPEFDTLADRLREAGYYTSGVAGGFLAHHQFGLAQGMHRYRDPDGFETRGGALTDAVLAQIADSSPRPRFLFANYFDPHALFQAPEPFRRQFGVEEAAAPLREREVWGALVDGDGSVLSAAIRGEGGFGPEVEEYLRRAYRAELAWMDAQLGRLFEGLRRAGQWEKSLIVVVADHGELLGERGLFTHAHRLDPELIEIPLLIKWPGQTTGYRVASPVSQVDLFPTLLRAAGVAIPQDQRGVLLYPDREPSVTEDRPLLFEEHESAPHPLFSEMKVAQDLVGVQIGDLRITGLDDVRACQRIVEGVWREADCPSGVWELDQLMAVVEDKAAPASSDSVADSVARSAAEEAALRALGYL